MDIIRYIYYDEDGNTITDNDFITSHAFRYDVILKDNILPVDDINKFAYDDDDYEYVAYLIQNESNSPLSSPDTVESDLQELREAICELYELMVSDISME